MGSNKVKESLPIPVVQVAGLWALAFACLYAAVAAYATGGRRPRCHHRPSSSWWTSCYGLKGSDAVEAAALLAGQLWCSAAQACAAAASLLLPGHRRRSRRALALAALAATSVNHCVFGRLVGLLLVAAPGNLLLRVAYWVFINAVMVDISGFLILLADDDD